MVRPVEPDPPQPVSKSPERVRATTATPEQLGKSAVREQGDRSGRRREKAKEQTLDALTLTEERAPDSTDLPGAKAGRDTVPMQAGVRKAHDHLDVKG